MLLDGRCNLGVGCSVRQSTGVAHGFIQGVLKRTKRLLELLNTLYFTLSSFLPRLIGPLCKSQPPNYSVARAGLGAGGRRRRRRWPWTSRPRACRRSPSCRRPSTRGCRPRPQSRSRPSITAADADGGSTAFRRLSRTSTSSRSSGEDGKPCSDGSFLLT